MKKVIFAILLCLMVTSAHAQFYSVAVDTSGVKEIHRFGVKWVGSQLMGRYSSNMIAFEHRIAPVLSLQHSLGLLNNNQDFVKEGFFENKQGFKLASQLRIYEDDFFTDNRFFAAIEPFYTFAEFDRTRVFEVSCGFAGCSYYQKATYPLKEKLGGARIRFGYMGYLYDFIIIEFDLGIGYSQRTIQSSGKPLNIIRVQDTFNYQDEMNKGNIAYDFGVRLGYIFK